MSGKGKPPRHTGPKPKPSGALEDVLVARTPKRRGSMTDSEIRSAMIQASSAEKAAARRSSMDYFKRVAAAKKVKGSGGGGPSKPAKGGKPAGRRMDQDATAKALARRLERRRSTDVDFGIGDVLAGMHFEPDPLSDSDEDINPEPEFNYDSNSAPLNYRLGTGAGLVALPSVMEVPNIDSYFTGAFPALPDSRYNSAMSLVGQARKGITKTSVGNPFPFAVGNYNANGVYNNGSVRSNGRAQSPGPSRGRRRIPSLVDSNLLSLERMEQKLAKCKEELRVTSEKVVHLLSKYPRDGRKYNRILIELDGIERYILSAFDDDDNYDSDDTIGPDEKRENVNRIRWEF